MSNLIKLGFVLITLSFMLIFIVIAIILVITMQSITNIDSSIGGCIVILFIPICFGTGTHVLPIIIMAMILSIVVLVISFLISRTSIEKAINKLKSNDLI